MIATHLGPSADMPQWTVWLACALAFLSLAMLAFEMRRREQREHGGLVIAATGILAVCGLLASVLRPARVTARESSLGARVVVLADVSRSMALPGDDGRPRRAARDEAIARLKKSESGARVVVLGFGDGAPSPMATPTAATPAVTPAATRAGTSDDDGATARAPRSDLAAALRALSASSDERPAAVVVVSDGRLDDPPEEATVASMRRAFGALNIPIDAIATTRDVPADVSIRHVDAAGAAVAHVPLPLRVDVGCAGNVSCDALNVTARELTDDGPPSLLASGVLHTKDGKGTIDMTITLERAGPRIVEVAVEAPPGDTIPENNRRLLTFDVTRERIRVLHVAGRPTSDVRALRQWLKSDASVDVVAFFILRTPTDDSRATQNELALIPFPVDELFTEHLPSFDAVVLQDFDAQPYGLEKYLDNLARYVRSGGGLVMVGGQNSFVAGGYAGTPLADVLPVGLDESQSASGADTAPFVPVWTPAGRAAPLLAPLRDVVGDALPEMPGANVLGDARPSAMVLWSHPTRVTASGAPMPVLAVGEEGDGRTIALGVDGAWQLEFSELGARTAGRGHGALWDGLLGWLMRDPRFETAQMSVTGGCTAGLPSVLHAQRVPQAASPNAKPDIITLDVSRIDRAQAPVHLSQNTSADTAAIDFALPPLEAGAYAARLRIAGGTGARLDFACEAGGDEWADSRPDGARLQDLARATGGRFAWASDGASLDLPKPTVVSAERHVTPIAPPWAWSLVAATLLGLHWIARRRSGLS